MHTQVRHVVDVLVTVERGRISKGFEANKLGACGVQRDCMAPLNRDRNGATNCGTNFMSLMKNLPTIRSLSDEELAFHRATLCMECG